MKNTSFLAIFDTLFILSLLGFLLTKNSAIFFVFHQSIFDYFISELMIEKLDVFDDKLLRLLKLDTTIYAIGFMTLYVTTYFTVNNIELPFNVKYFFGIAIFLFSIAFVISIKRKKLAQDLLIEKYRNK